MAQRAIMRKATWEDKFERKYWTANNAKRSWIRWQKQYNNKTFRRLMKIELDKAKESNNYAI